MIQYSFDTSDRFTITSYNSAKPFASFLPGIAGARGIPLWAFYVNRGQGMASFGIQDKNNSIMEYYPANKSYQLVPTHGFRTFLILQSDQKRDCYEPFSSGNRTPGRQEKMYIGPNELEIEEIHPELGLRVNVLYFLLPGEEFAGLVREVTITNIASRSMAVELADGMPAVVPYGTTNWMLKEMSNTSMAWMGVENLEEGIPFFRLRASPKDTPEVEKIEAGHFSLAFSQAEGSPRLLPAIVDPAVIFGQLTDFSHPDAFWGGSWEKLRSQKQVTTGRMPCCFYGTQATLEPGQAVQINAIIGHVDDLSFFHAHLSRLADPEYFRIKRQEANTLVHALTERLATHTSSRIFDLYCRQTFLDNILRGGVPVLLENGKEPFIYHLYSRKHGDLERDYNFFSVAPEFYSQGDGNYRDIIQNRRMDVLLEPRVERYNILTFMNLLQADGYNPLSVKGTTFLLENQKISKILRLLNGGTEKMRDFLNRPYRPGQLIKYINNNRIDLKISMDQFFSSVLGSSEQLEDAAYGDGYWVDHWTYNLDLIENYLSVFPDREEDLLFGRSEYTFFDSAALVLPRSEKYVLVDGKVRQLGIVTENRAKKDMIGNRACYPNWARTDHGKGKIYRTTLGAKLLCLALTKFTLLDPWGMGIEMEAGRPGWCDALNGLPGLFGSSMADTYALRKFLQFLLNIFSARTGPRLRLPVEVYGFLMKVGNLLKIFPTMPENEREYQYWNAVSETREEYRREVTFGFEGAERELPIPEAQRILTDFLGKVEEGIARALELNEGTYPTYFYYEADEYEELRDQKGKPIVDSKNRPYVRVKRFRPIVMPIFLEGMTRAMSLQRDQASARRLYQAVRGSELFDRKLQMYRINASVQSFSHDIGRIRAFSGGVLENESIFLHMEYKYLLEILRAGLYEEFFQESKTCLIPFQDPSIYGRSPLENSTFIASSAHADERMHGNGFVGRLSGSSAEFLSIWCLMMMGSKPFRMKEKQLCLEFRPALPGWMFDEAGIVSFRFLGLCDVTYHNPEKLNVFPGSDLTINRILIHENGKNTTTISDSIIREPHASRVRSGLIKTIDIFFKGKR
jgi:hypothetical protein